MPDYLVTQPIIHDGETYLPGATLALDDSHAASLLALGAIKAVPAATPTPAPAPALTTAPVDAIDDAAVTAPAPSAAPTSAPTPKTKAGK